MSEDRPFGPRDLERFYARQREQILARAAGAGPLRHDEVERFFARQRDQILARVTAGTAGARAVAVGRRLLLPLAAAALLLLVFGPLLRPGAEVEPPAVEEGWGEAILSEATGQEASLPLPAYGPWTLDDLLASPAADSPVSIGWLLEDAVEDEEPDETLPEFLAPYGAWSEAEAAGEAAI